MDIRVLLKDVHGRSWINAALLAKAMVMDTWVHLQRMHLTISQFGNASNIFSNSVVFKYSKIYDIGLACA